MREANAEQKIKTLFFILFLKYIAVYGNIYSE